jgi:L-lactate utilization protein LutC
MSTRDEFLGKVRSAVSAGNRRNVAPDLPNRGDCGYQGAGRDWVSRFSSELTAAGGKAYRAADVDAAREIVLQVIREHRARNVILGSGATVASLQLAEAAGELGVQLVPVEHLDDNAAEKFFSADLSVTGTDYLIAETGSVVYLSRAAEPRSASLLPAIHVVVARTEQLVPDLFDLFERLPPATAALPACVTIITGPSKTGDIELKLVTGVHGPGELHVIVID